MADGRMLKKVICESPKLAALKNDTHRLIYTWLIPHLDVEGRHSADPRIVKSHVAPILDHITMKIITAALNDLAENNLITLYSVDGKQFLELQLFKKHQTLREGREKKSDIPSPTDGVPTEYRRSTAQQDKIREDKIREDKAAPDKVRHLDCVLLSKNEYEKLKVRYGDLTECAIEVLNNYKMKSGKNYKSDYHALLEDWVREKANGHGKGITRLPKEYIGEKPPEISEAERAENLRRLRGITASSGPD